MITIDMDSVMRVFFGRTPPKDHTDQPCIVVTCVDKVSFNLFSLHKRCKRIESILRDGSTGKKRRDAIGKRLAIGIKHIINQRYWSERP